MIPDIGPINDIDTFWQFDAFTLLLQHIQTAIIVSLNYVYLSK